VAGLLAFLQAFPNLACFAPSFSKQSFGGFVGFQGVASLQNPKCGTPNFLPLPPSFNRIPDAAPPHSVTSPGNGSRVNDRSLRVAALWGGRRVHDGSDPGKERILNQARIQFIRKECTLRCGAPPRSGETTGGTAWFYRRIQLRRLRSAADRSSLTRLLKSLPRVIG
jgi:hypothetical protein